MKKHILFLAVALFVMAFSSCKVADRVFVDEEASTFSDFYVEEDQVFISCNITLVNQFDEEKAVQLSAVLPEDVDGGLLKNEKVKALNEDGTEMIFTLLPNSSESFDVVFVGEFAGMYQKNNRNLPEIQVEIVKK